MKKILYTMLIVAAVLSSCINIDQIENNRIDNPPVFTAIVDEVSTTRTYIDSNFQQLWSENDCISVFFSSSRSGRYRYIGTDVDGNGCFTPAGVYEIPKELFAVYPYNDATSITSSGVLNLYLPAIQKYRESSFAPGSNTMVAVTENSSDYLLRFKNVCGYIVIRLYGEGNVKCISLQGNNREVIAGPATVKALYGEAPVVEMTSKGRSISIDCGADGVQLNSSSSDPTEFWFCVPPTVFSQGFTVVAYTTDGKMMKKSVNSTRSVERNVINRMTPIEASFTITDTVTGGEANLPDGPTFNASIKQLINPLATEKTKDSSVKRIIFKTNSVIAGGIQIADSYSDKPIYASYEAESGIVTISTPAETIYADADASYIFSNFTALEEFVNLQCINTSEVEDMRYAFNACGASEIDCTGWDTSNTTNQSYLFYNCLNLHTLRLGDSFVGPLVTTSTCWFAGTINEPGSAGEFTQTGIVPGHVDIYCSADVMTWVASRSTVKYVNDGHYNNIPCPVKFYDWITNTEMNPGW